MLVFPLRTITTLKMNKLFRLRRHRRRQRSQNRNGRKLLTTENLNCRSRFLLDNNQYVAQIVKLWRSKRKRFECVRWNNTLPSNVSFSFQPEKSLPPSTTFKLFDVLYSKVEKQKTSIWPLIEHFVFLFYFCLSKRVVVSKSVTSFTWSIRI